MQSVNQLHLNKKKVPGNYVSNEAENSIVLLIVTKLSFTKIHFNNFIKILATKGSTRIIIRDNIV